MSVRFALPPSLGSAQALERARGLADHLEQQLGFEVTLVVAADYQGLGEAVSSGEADAVWAPPLVCARLETRGLRVAIRGVRDGASTYRSALVCRRSEPLSLASLVGTRAAWVDPDSIGGHLLAVVMLKAQGLDPKSLFAEQKFVGSYREALLAVDRGEADVAAIFAPPGPDDSLVTGVADVLPEHTARFGVVGFSSESPNDGIVVSRALNPAHASAFLGALLAMHASADGAALLRHTFRIERFEFAPIGGYRALYRLAVSAM